jgi:hypothetical protein
MSTTKTTQKPAAVAAPAVDTTTSNVEFFTWEEFKDFFDIKKAEVVKNPNTGKLFVASGSHRWKCQGDIDFELPMRFLVEEEDYDNACLVNVTESDNVQYSFN